MFSSSVARPPSEITTFVELSSAAGTHPAHAVTLLHAQALGRAARRALCAASRRPTSQPTPPLHAGGAARGVRRRHGQMHAGNCGEHRARFVVSHRDAVRKLGPYSNMKIYRVRTPPDNVRTRSVCLPACCSLCVEEKK